MVGDTEACRSYEVAVGWSQQGPQGIPGPQGAQGPAGKSQVFFGEQFHDSDLEGDFIAFVGVFVPAASYVVEASILLHNLTNASRPVVCRIGSDVVAGAARVHFIAPHESVDFRLTSAITQPNEFAVLQLICADSLGEDFKVEARGGTLLATKVDSVNGF